MGSTSQLSIWIPVSGYPTSLNQVYITPSLVSISSLGSDRSPEPNRIYGFTSLIVKSDDKFLDSPALMRPVTFGVFHDWR